MKSFTFDEKESGKVKRKHKQTNENKEECQTICISLWQINYQSILTLFGMEHKKKKPNYNNNTNNTNNRVCRGFKVYPTTNWELFHYFFFFPLLINLL